MRASPYNNPLFAEGLAGLVKSFIGNPVQTAQAELMAAQAKNENMTADYRQMMDVGLQGDLSAMMIRALQAGPEYSGNAPKISAAVNQNNAGILGMPAGGSRGGGGGGSSTPTGGPGEVGPLDLKRLMEVYMTEDQRTNVGAKPIVDAINYANENGVDVNTAILEALTGIQHTPETTTDTWMPFDETTTPESWQYVSPFTTAPTPSEGIGQPAQTTAQPKTEQEYQALPSGTRYIAPDGSVRVKP